MRERVWLGPPDTAPSASGVSISHGVNQLLWLIYYKVFDLKLVCVSTLSTCTEIYNSMKWCNSNFCRLADKRKTTTSGQNESLSKVMLKVSV